MLSYALKPRTRCERYSCAQSFSDGQTKRPPEGGLPAALMKAEIRPRERPRPPISLPSLESIYVVLARAWSQKSCSAGEITQALP